MAGENAESRIYLGIHYQFDAIEGIRTGEWEFAIFTAAGEPFRVNPEKDCMPCHREVASTDYTFTVSRFLAE